MNKVSPLMPINAFQAEKKSENVAPSSLQDRISHWISSFAWFSFQGLISKKDAVMSSLENTYSRMLKTGTCVKNFFASKQEIIAIAHSKGKVISIKSHVVLKSDLQSDQTKCYQALVKETREFSGKRRGKVGLCQLEQSFFSTNDKITLIDVNHRNKQRVKKMETILRSSNVFYGAAIMSFLRIKTEGFMRIQHFLR